MQTPEQQFILRKFHENFDQYKYVPMALYGLGANTKLILDNVSGFNIIGLMDAELIGEKVMGFPVLSPQEAAEKVRIIVILARSSVLKIICRRIAFLHEINGIHIYDVNGNHLDVEQVNSKPEKLTYWNLSLDDLLKAIETHDIISFDIFDTLIMRRVPQPCDIWKILGLHIFSNPHFPQRRLEAEQKLFQEDDKDHSLAAIYEKSNLNPITPEEEFSLELKLALPRSAMVYALNFAIDNKKKIFLLSDMYLSSKQIKTILKKCGINHFSELNVSCETKQTKRAGEIFATLKRDFPNQKILHIGDDLIADQKIPEQMGLDTFPVLSAYEMVANSSCNKILSKSLKPNELLFLGDWIARLFNNPFILHDGEGRICVKSMFQLGNWFIGPLISSFMRWFIKETNQYDAILFLGRDGFFFEQLYKKLKFKNAPPGYYLHTSRRSVSVASIRSVQDILEILSKSFRCTLGDLLEKRFGVIPNENDSRNSCSVISSENISEAEEYILSYQDQIFKNAVIEREGYQKYLKSIGINADSRVAAFDLVSSGTVQHYLQKLAPWNITGFYLAAINVPNQFFHEGEIRSYYKTVLSFYEPQSNACRFYLLLESCFTAPYPPLRCISSNGFVWNDQDEPHRKWSSIKMCHEGISAYVLDHWHHDISGANELADTIFGFLFDGSIHVNKKIRDSFIMESSYDFISEFHVWDQLC